MDHRNAGMAQSPMSDVDPNRLLMGACRHHHCASRTRSCGRGSHVQEVHATNPVSLHHHLLDWVQEDDLSSSKCGVKPKIIKLVGL